MNLFISFSGGRTSAYMTKWLLENKQDDYNEIVVLFANTGEEHNETLEFVNKCDKAWKFNVVWLEVLVNQEFGKGSRFTVTNYKDAKRKGEPFQSVIEKYGIPNKAGAFCTRELKLAPMNSYIKSLGWKKGTYETAIGIRADEMDRISSKMVEFNIIYPLAEENRQSRKTINSWWAKQDFNLEIPEHHGNCKFCFKKSKRKLLTIAKYNPEFFEFPIRMEALHGRTGNHSHDEERKFFRNRTSAIEIIEASKQPFKEFDASTIDTNLDLFDMEMDTANGCSESCEVY